MPIAAMFLPLWLTTSVSLDYRPSAADAAPMPYAPTPVVVATARPRHHWYGWQLLISDALFVGIAATANDHSPALSAAGFGGLALAAPLLHVANGNSKNAIISVLVRSLAAALMYSVMNGSWDWSRSHQNSDSELNLPDGGEVLSVLVVTAAVIAGGAFVVVDDSIRARKLVHPDDASPSAGAASPPAKPAAVVAPTVFLQRQGGGIGLAAAF